MKVFDGLLHILTAPFRQSSVDSENRAGESRVKSAPHFYSRRQSSEHNRSLNRTLDVIALMSDHSVASGEQSLIHVCNGSIIGMPRWPRRAYQTS